MRLHLNGTFYKNSYFWLGIVFGLVTVLENVYLNVAYNWGGVGASAFLILVGLFQTSGQWRRD